MWSGSFKTSLLVRRSSHICLLTWFACCIMDLHDVFSLQVFWVKVHKAIIKLSMNLFFMINYLAIHGNTTLNREYVWYSIYKAESRLVPSQWETSLQSKLNLNSVLIKSGLPITYLSIVRSFWNFAQSMAVSLPCSVLNLKMIYCWNGYQRQISFPAIWI